MSYPILYQTLSVKSKRLDVVRCQHFHFLRKIRFFLKIISSTNFKQLTLTSIDGLHPQPKGAKIQYTEGSPWFWKIFGGAIVGIISILLLTHITSINSNIDRSFLSLRSEIKDVLANLDSQKERVVSLEQHKEQCRERQVNLEKTLSQVQVSLDEARAKIASYLEFVKTCKGGRCTSTKDFTDFNLKENNLKSKR